MEGKSKCHTQSMYHQPVAMLKLFCLQMKASIIVLRAGHAHLASGDIANVSSGAQESSKLAASLF